MSAATTITNEPASTDLLAPATTGLEASTVESLRALFVPFLDKAREWEKRALAIHVTREDQKREMKFARESRLALREIRCAVENTRKASKADALSRSKAIDGLANAIKGVIEPIEAHLLTQETFAERAQDARRDALRSARAEALIALGADPSVFAALGELSEEAWSALLDNTKLANEARLEAERQKERIRVEAERIAAETRAAERAAAVKAEAARIERERVQAEENARLRAEAAEREVATQAERARVEAERAVEREKAGEEAALARAEKDRELAAMAAKTQKAREATDAAARALAKVQAEAAQAKAEAEQATREREAADLAVRAAEDAAREAALLAPDRQKLQAFATGLRALLVPTFTTERGQAAGAKLSEQLAKMASWVEKTASAL